MIDPLIDALCQELRCWSSTLTDRQISTVFLGGGTPTILSVEQLQRIFDTLYQQYSFAEGCEITSEVNPGVVDRTKFQGLRELGVNRLSLGVQSFQESELHFLGRVHNVADVYAAYDAANAAGFDNINLDFMFGLPEQDAEAWQATLEEAIALAPSHLSLYSLIVEPNTVLHHWVQTGRVSSPDDDLAATQYEAAMEMMGNAGYIHYEVSNWANSIEHACKHNLTYWRNDDYLGFGPGAHSHLRVDTNHLSDALYAEDLSTNTLAAQPVNAQPVNAQLASMLSSMALVADDDSKSRFREFRWGNGKSVPGYIKRIRTAQPTGEFIERPDRLVSMGETMMLGLRLLHEGVPRERFIKLYEQDLTEVYKDEIATLTSKGLIHVDENRIALSPAGLMVGNQVFTHFLSV